MDRIDDMLLRWEEGRDRGSPPTADTLCPDDPELRGRLARDIRLLEAYDALMTAAAPVTPAAYPARVGKYEIRGAVGAGGMGVVYDAWDPDLARRVAVKVVHPRLLAARGAAAVPRFVREGQALAKLSRTNTVAVYEAGVFAGVPYIVMEFVPGGSLATHRPRLTAAGPAAVARIIEKVARAVDAAHARGVLHRDLKPANVLLDGDEPFVADFGLAALAAADAETLIGHADNVRPAAASTVRGVGTPGYMAPEQADPAGGPVSAAADIYALGVILHELLTGAKPAGAGGLTPPAPPPETCRTGRRLLAVAARCREADPARRFPTAAAMADALRRAAAPRRWPAVAAAAALCLGAVAATDRGPFAPAVWPHLPAVRAATAALARGETVELVAPGKVPTAYDWPRGPATGKLLQRDDGTLTVTSTVPGGCLLELLPALPPGRFRIDAELFQEAGDGMCWVGVYAAAGHGAVARGRQHAYVAAQYTDFGQSAVEVPNGNMPASNRRTHLGAFYLGDSVRHAVEGSADLARPFGRFVPPPPRGTPRVLSLTIDGDAVTAAQAGRPVATLTRDEVRAARADAAANRPDLAAVAWPAELAGGVGVYVHNSNLVVTRFTVVPLAPAE